MAKKNIEIQGLTIKIEQTLEEDYVSMTDMAAQCDRDEPRFLVMHWLKNQSTLEFLETWEALHNPDFIKGVQMDTFKKEYYNRRKSLSPKRWIEGTNAIGIISKQGKGGGTFAHKDIALNFAYYLSPAFQVYMIKEFQRLKEEEYRVKNLEWHVRLITDRIDDVRNLLDTIPGQSEKRNRLIDPGIVGNID